MDIGTSSSSVDEALGAACCAVFSTCDDLWEKIKFAGVHTGDRVWRMPLWQHFTKQLMSGNRRADIQNVGIGRGGDPCKTAAFLREFVPDVPWMHIVSSIKPCQIQKIKNEYFQDAHGVIKTNGKDLPYLKSGMAGRPTRTLVELIAQTICIDQPNKKK